MERQQAQAKDHLYLSVLSPANEQARLNAVGVRGQCDALDFVVTMELEDLLSDDERAK